MDSAQREIFVTNALKMLKWRLDKMADDTSRDEYYTMRIKQAIAKLERRKIILTDEADDLMLVVDLAAWLHSNRDKKGEMDRWLWFSIRGRWINNDP